MLTQLSNNLRKLQLPLRLAFQNGATLDLGPDPAVTLEILDSNLISELTHPSLDLLGEAYINKRLNIHGPIISVMEIADQLSMSTITDKPVPAQTRSAHDKALRIWRIYPAGFAYGFRKNWINIHQILAVKPYTDGSHDLPLTRADIYS